MGNNRLGLIFEIAADPSKAVKAVDYFSAQQKAAAEAVVRSNHIISESYAKVGKQTMTAAADQKAWMDSLQQATLRNIAATKAASEADHRSIVQAEVDYLAKAKAIEGVTAATVETGVINREVAAEIRTQFLATQKSQQGMMQGFYDSITGLRQFRSLFAATIGFASFGFWFVEWGRLLSGLEDGIHFLEGFSAAAQKAFAELVKDADQALIHVGGLTTAAKIATTQALIAQTDQRINLDQTTRAAIASQSFWHNFGEEISSVVEILSGAQMLLSQKVSFDIFSQAKEKAHAFADEMKADVLVGKQRAALTALEKQLHEEQTKGAKAGASAASKEARELQHAQEVAGRWYAASLRAIAQEKREQDAWNKSMEKSIEHAIKLGETVETSAAKHSAALHKSALATLPQGPKNEVPGSAGGDMFFQAAQASVKPLTAQRQALLALNDAFAGTHTSMQNFTGEAAVASAASDKFARGMGHAITQAVVYGQSVGKAVETALKGTLASIAEEAAVRSLFSLATYWIDMATYQYTSAAQALTAAEIFGAVAGGAGAAALAIPGGGGGGSHGGRGSASRNAGSRSGGTGGSGGSRGGSNSGQQVVPSGNFPSGPKSGNLTIAVMGESEAGAWLANTINKAVQQGGAELTATHTTAIPQPTA